jgi:hypothetical protein
MIIFPLFFSLLLFQPRFIDLRISLHLSICLPVCLSFFLSIYISMDLCLLLLLSPLFVLCFSLERISRQGLSLRPLLSSGCLRSSITALRHLSYSSVHKATSARTMRSLRRYVKFFLALSSDLYSAIRVIIVIVIINNILSSLLFVNFFF